MSTSELSREFDVRQAEGKQVRIVADEAERAALAERFGLVSIGSLEADLLLNRKGDREVEAQGSLKARFVQSCAVSAEDIPVSVEEPLLFRFVPERTHHTPDEEIEIDADDCDEIEYSGAHFDLGEAVAQSLALTIDPFLTGPGADRARKEAGIGTPEEQGPFAALKSLKPGS
ncbi:DNA-binding protein [Novosphingobium endophyticum]|uniref:DNA-binding protein n=1 Tax=Novosphingobium endophyticum TaxID=1955250 RepID=A0A916X6N1_9SPHN|nr:YceD family protein [Novosphingobium endophyticum]GGC07403.1 DNA-binding protein [Novosphingobium endophyticum]